jgi:tetratricopeptide (TPR) repeat protein
LGRVPRLIFMCNLILIAILAAAVAQDTGKTVRHHRVAVEDSTVPPELTQAETALQKSDFTTAEPLLKTLTTRDPSNYRAWFDLGFVYNAQGKTEDSIGAYRKSVAAKPDVFESNLNLGLMLAKAKQADAEEYLRAATKLKPTDHVEEGQARAWLSLGHVLEGSKPDEALEAYRNAAKLQPGDVEPHLSAGPVLEKQNKYAEAEQEYKHVLAIDPNSADALIGIANIYMRGTRYPEAAEILRKLIAQQPKYAPGHIQLGRVLAASSKFADAIPEFQAGLRLTPSDKDAQRDLAEVYASAGQYKDAQLLYEALLGASPNDPSLHYSLGRSYMKQRKFPEAQQQFLATLKLKPDFGEAYGDLAMAADQNKDYGTTIRALDLRAKFLAERPATYFLRATAYDHLRAYKQAAENYHLFLQASNGQLPDQEWQARHRLIAIEPKK